MNFQKIVKKLTLEDNNDVFLMSDWNSDSVLFLKLLNVKNNKSYEGQATEADLRNQAAGIRLTFNEFMRKTEQALFKPHHDNFRYSLHAQDASFNFKWKSIDEEQTIIHLGLVKMNQKESSETCTDILQSAAEEIQKMNVKLQNVTSQLHSYRNQNLLVMADLELATRAKETFENEMFAKFVLILNEKKRRITQLEAGNKIVDFCDASKKFRHPLASSDTEEEVESAANMQRPGPSSRNRNSITFSDDMPVVSLKQKRIRKRKKVVKSSSLVQKNVTNIPKIKPIPKQEEDSDNSLLDFL